MIAKTTLKVTINDIPFTVLGGEKLPQKVIDYYEKTGELKKLLRFGIVSDDAPITKSVPEEKVVFKK